MYHFRAETWLRRSWRVMLERRWSFRFARARASSAIFLSVMSLTKRRMPETFPSRSRSGTLCVSTHRIPPFRVCICSIMPSLGFLVEMTSKSSL
ncbi:MAG: hypothetical protein A4E39_01110 [Methanoregulaceae archaeon PtaB.Bin152]|nr:MAG: hypothetical protein A4E39_01110 [Methanoregulaceae archaeon PtaB.Bin152]